MIHIALLTAAILALSENDSRYAGSQEHDEQAEYAGYTP